MIFDWDDLRCADQDQQPTREAAIRRAFKQHMSGNSHFEGMSSPEIQGLFNEFRTGWLVCEIFVKTDN